MLPILEKKFLRNIFCFSIKTPKNKSKLKIIYHVFNMFFYIFATIYKDGIKNIINLSRQIIINL